MGGRTQGCISSGHRLTSILRLNATLLPDVRLLEASPSVMLQLISIEAEEDTSPSSLWLYSIRGTTPATS